MLIPRKDTIKQYHIYEFSFIDDVEFIKDASEYFQSDDVEGIDDERRKAIDDGIKLIKERFREHGWEGDGQLGIIWLPPFIDNGGRDVYIWHVKQSNNGQSFIASDCSLPFTGLI